MSELPEIRIGTADREQAQEKLGLHFGEGRLTPAEFDERSVLIASASTRGEIDKVFADLPAGSGVSTSPPPSTPSASSKPPARADEGFDWRNIAMPIVVFGSLALFFLTDFDQSWLFFLLIPLAGAIFYAGDRSKNKDS